MNSQGKSQEEEGKRLRKEHVFIIERMDVERGIAWLTLQVSGAYSF